VKSHGPLQRFVQPLLDQGKKRLWKQSLLDGTEIDLGFAHRFKHQEPTMPTTAVTAAERPTWTCQADDFATFVRDRSRELFRYAYRLCGDVHTAEDLVQESLLRAWRSRTGLQNPAAARAWLYTIVRRENARRFERMGPPPAELPEDDRLAGRPQFDTSTEAFALRRALETLPTEYREPLLLQVIHGHSQQEIAERLGLTCAAVGTRLFRARAKLREAIGGAV
jgi:RNA polymerase sigma-70 factor (ECF subfamily)